MPQNFDQAANKLAVLLLITLLLAPDCLRAAGQQWPESAGQQNQRANPDSSVSSLARALMLASSGSPSRHETSGRALQRAPSSPTIVKPGQELQRRALPASRPRTLGLLAFKAMLLGPLIGLTIKAAIIRGLIWALLAYGLHLFFPSLLSSLGLGSGLVGFARQLRPDYSQLLAGYLSNLNIGLPNSIQQMARQYRQLLSPVIESIRSIPEGHCRFRAVCETASHLVRQTRSLSTTLQRISATVYMNFGTDYTKAWLDGIVQSDCAAKYPQCQGSPFSMVAARLAQSLGVGQQQLALQQQHQQQQQLVSMAAQSAGASAVQQALAGATAGQAPAVA